MKKSLTILAVLALTGTAIASAEETTPAPKPDRPPRGPDNGARMQTDGLFPPGLVDQLALTDEQKTKLAELDKQVAQARADWMALHQKFIEQFMGMLTDEQKEKLAKMHQDQRGGGGSPRMQPAGLLPPGLVDQLALTDEQKTKLAELDKQCAQGSADWMATNKLAMDQLRKDMEEARAAQDQAKIESLQPQFRELNKGMMSLRQKLMEQFMGMLTDEQKQKLDKIRQEQRGGRN